MMYPALQLDASSSSDSAQRLFLRLVRLEYGLLISISLGYLYLPATTASQILLMVLVLVALASSGYRAWKKPDEDWYQFRALAESIKTLTWRFATRSEPFNLDDRVAKAEFRNSLVELLKVNAALGTRFAAYKPEADQITVEMLGLRTGTLQQRKLQYLNKRIQDQRTWYAHKATLNRKTAKRWQIVLAVVYVVILVVIGIRIANPVWVWLSPDPLLLVASSIVGWMQVKKFNDLAAAYLLTAQEIGIASSEMDDIEEETLWSDFVFRCEQVFSREHTQWVVRRRT